VDLSLSENPCLACAADFIPNPNAPEAAPGYDGDGFTNEQESHAGTDPTNGTSTLRLANFSRTANSETSSLIWACVPGKTYNVENSQSLLSPDWTTLGSPVTATATTSALTSPLVPTDERRFYRVKVVP
jgi:hypothetical protein